MQSAVETLELQPLACHVNMQNCVAFPVCLSLSVCQEGIYPLNSCWKVCLFVCLLFKEYHVSWGTTLYTFIII